LARFGCARLAAKETRNEWFIEPASRRAVVDGQCGAQGDHNTAGITGTAMRVVNAIPAVCEATPGIVSILDLPIFTAPHPKARRR